MGTHEVERKGTPFDQRVDPGSLVFGFIYPSQVLREFDRLPSSVINTQHRDFSAARNPVIIVTPTPLGITLAGTPIKRIQFFLVMIRLLLTTLPLPMANFAPLSVIAFERR